MAQVSARVARHLREQLTALPPMDLPQRTKRLREQLSETGCEALIVSDLVNVRYLTGFSGSAGLLMVKEDDAVLVTDGRYKDQAKKELAKFGAEARSVALKAQEQLELLGELSRGPHEARPGSRTPQLGQGKALGGGLGQGFGAGADQRARRRLEAAQGRGRDSTHRGCGGHRGRGARAW